MKTILSLTCLAAAGLVPARGYELHEWGTFTTVAGSDGVLLDGLQREEEALPPFVRAHFGFENGQMQPDAEMTRIARAHGIPHFFAGVPLTKGFGKRPVKNVTVKMETPVLYFHSRKAFHARVKVGFNGGSISQWYPQRSGGEVLPEPPTPADPKTSPTPLSEWTIDFAPRNTKPLNAGFVVEPYRGSIEWDVDVLSPADSRKATLFKPRDTLSWMRARTGESNVVRTKDGQTEGYLFYRGIGNFQPGLRTIADKDGTLRMENGTGGDIPFALVYERVGPLVSWKALPNGLKQGATATVNTGFTGLTVTPATGMSPDDSGVRLFHEDLYHTLKNGLAARGLTEAEARAMVETWWDSYFETDGLRVFWVLPDAKTHGILPLEVTPKPEKTVRVLVGRSEVLAPEREKNWLAMSQSPDMKAGWESLVATDRFGLAIQRRVEALTRASTASVEPR